MAHAHPPPTSNINPESYCRPLRPNSRTGANRDRHAMGRARRERLWDSSFEPSLGKVSVKMVCDCFLDPVLHVFPFWGRVIAPQILIRPRLHACFVVLSEPPAHSNSKCCYGGTVLPSFCFFVLSHFNLVCK